MRIFATESPQTQAVTNRLRSLGELDLTFAPPDLLATAVAGQTPALVALALDPSGIASIATELCRNGCRFEVCLIALIETASAVDAALDAGADDVFICSESDQSFNARLRASAHALTTRIGFALELGVSVEVADGAGRLQYVNPAFEALTGYALEEVRGRNITAFLCEDETASHAHRSAWDRLVEQGFWNGTVPARARTGRRQLHELTLSSVRRGRGAVEYVVGQRRDVTERVVTEEQVELLEAELRRTEHMATLGTLAAGVAHEINNPLTYVISNVSYVLESLRARDLPSDVDALRDAMEGCDRVKRIVADLRLFSRSTNEEIEVVELEPVLESAANIAASELRHRARLVRDFANIPPVRGSRARLGQVFLNLITNAAQAISPGDPDNNQVCLRTGVTPDGWVFVEITDTGSGMDPGLLERIFEPFFTTKPAGSGTGLGLSLSHGIVTSLGGTLTASSVKGAGSTFVVELLPAPRSSLFMRTASRSLPPATIRRARILVIDDEPQVGRAMQRTLSEHDVTVAVGAEEGRLSLLGGPAFDAVFCDVIMPGTSGIDLFLDPAVGECPTPRDRWVFMSGGTREPRLGEFLQRIDNPFLAKPCSPREVLAALAHAQTARPEQPVSNPTLPATARSPGPPH